MALKEKILGIFGLGAGSLGSAGAFGACHALCTGAVSALGLIGISITGMPLMFLNQPKFYIPFIIVGIGLIGASIYLYRNKKCCELRKAK